MVKIRNIVVLLHGHNTVPEIKFPIKNSSFLLDTLRQINIVAKAMLIFFMLKYEL